MTTREVFRKTCLRPGCAALLLLIVLLPASSQTTTPQQVDWPFYGNDPGGMRFVDLDQINPGNVASLEPAWIFHTNVHECGYVV